MIEFKDVFQSFGGRPVLRGLSFNVKDGECFVLMGPSGSGKSTTLLHIVGVYKARRGEVVVQGVDVGKNIDNPDVLVGLRRKIGLVFQGGALVNWLNVYDNVALPLREALELEENEIESRVNDALEKVLLSNDSEKLPSELSGGMRKRVALARALVTRPPLILYDEPTAGLDPAMSAQIARLIVDFSQHGVTSVVVTHDVDCARRVASRIAILSKGKIQVEGDKSLLDGNHPSVLEFLGHPA
ncbi:MAG: ATP-binding cassette domain-containing protein [Planctomycetes bacterium]|nr:ATP-binding cassette domain-containing protein [Planctomycetota bacterium]